MHIDEIEDTMTPAVLDQRKSARIPCCRIAKISMVLDPRAPWRRSIAPVVVRSVSCDGLRLTLLDDTARAPRRSDDVTILLTGEARELEVPAYVAWCTWKGADGAATELGARLRLEELRPRHRVDRVGRAHQAGSSAARSSPPTMSETIALGDKDVAYLVGKRVRRGCD